MGKFLNFLKQKSTIVLGASILSILVGGLMGSISQTSGYTVDVYSKTIEVEPVTSAAISKYQQTGVKESSVADFYVPKKASETNKVPLIFVVPGIQRTKETQASFCIELSRRGFGVICMDPFNQGDSTSTYEVQSATNEGYGLFNWMDELFEKDGKTLKETYNWVDATKIAACGHSAGGNACQKFAEREGKLAAERGTKSRVNGVYITGFIRGWSWKTTLCNVGISYSWNDEGAFQNQTAINKAAAQAKKDAGQSLTEAEKRWLSIANADLRYAPESIAIVNYQRAREGKAALSEIECGVDYGNPYKGTYAIINNETTLHALQPYDGPTLTHMIEFFNYTLEIDDPEIAPTKVFSWVWKECGSGLALIGGFVGVCALLCVLLNNVPFFRSLRHEKADTQKYPDRQANQGIKGRIFFWITFVIGAALACYLYMVCVKASTEWFPDAANSTQTWVFPQRFSNAVAMWAVINGIIGVAIFFLTWGLEWLIDYAAKKKQIAKGEATSEDLLPLRKSYLGKLDCVKPRGIANVGKTILVALALLAFFFGMNYLMYGLFHTDMRFFFLSMRPTFNWRVILACLMYLPFFFIFYFSNSFRVASAMRPANWPEWLSQLIAVLGNTVGLVAILMIEYIPMIQTGTIGYTSTVGPQWLFVNLLFSIIPLMALLPLGNRFFFNKTGKAWLGAIVICVIFIAMSTNSTTIYYGL